MRNIYKNFKEKIILETLEHIRGQYWNEKYEGLKSIQLSQHRVHWQTFVNTVMKL
jgi:hypothetical protein